MDEFKKKARGIRTWLELHVIPQGWEPEVVDRAITQALREAVEAEREACALEAEQQYPGNPDANELGQGLAIASKSIAQAIRNRGQ